MQANCSISTNQGYIGVMQTGRPSNRTRPPFGERLYQLREQAGLTQLQVAERLGISQRAYAFWEREPIALRAEQVTTLAKVLGVTTDLLLGLETTKPRGTGPAGKMRQLFEAASKLPRVKQKLVIQVLDTFLRDAQQGKAA